MAKKSAVYKDYTINREDNDSITVYKKGELCSNSMEAMKEIAKQCGFTIDEKWNTRQTGNKLIDFLNDSVQPTEQNSSPSDIEYEITDYLFGVNKKNKTILNFVCLTDPDRPVYALDIYPIPYKLFESYKSCKDEKECEVVREELSRYIYEKVGRNQIVLIDGSGSNPPVIRLDVVDPADDEVLFTTGIKITESWIPKISSDLNNEEKKNLQRVRQTLANSYYSANNPMEAALLETFKNISIKDNFTFLPSLLKEICKKDDKEQNDNTPYIITVKEFSQVELRYRFEVDKDKFTGLLNPGFWRLNEQLPPYLREMSLDKFTKGNYYTLNILEEQEADVICTCSNIEFHGNIKNLRYCFVNNKLEEIDNAPIEKAESKTTAKKGVSKDSGISNFASKLFSKLIK